jgi:DNA repair photolyase
MADTPKPEKIHGRGAVQNPAGRFERLQTVSDYSDLEPEEDAADPDRHKRLPTQIFRDSSKTIVATNNSPDVGMEATINPYRGCEHGCIYCYARPTHEYLGLSAGLDFETKIFAKIEAPQLLRKKLMMPTWEPKAITMSGVTDPYQPVERKLKITRGCLEVLAEFRNPVVIITKNQLATRDIDLLGELASYNAAAIMFSVTTLDPEICRTMEPRASQPKVRLRAIEAFAKAKIPVGIMIGPVVPGLTDHEIPSILEAAANAGALSAGYTMMRLPYGVKDLFQGWLDENFPDRKEKILSRVREVRDGKLNDPDFGSRMRGTGEYADHIAQMFRLYRRRYGLDKRAPLSADSFRRPAADGQLSFF